MLFRSAVIAEVEVNRNSGRVWARRFYVAHDCGQVIAPDLLRQTLEAQIVQTTSRALYEEVKFDNKNVTSVDWNGYPILDMKDAPETIDITLIDHPEMAPFGGGEATCRPIAAALANAIFDATGARLRQVPFAAEKVKTAWAAVSDDLNTKNVKSTKSTKSTITNFNQQWLNKQYKNYKI